MGDDTFINTSCDICWKKAIAQSEVTGKPFNYQEATVFYVPLMRDCKHLQAKTKVVCPTCKAIYNVTTAKANAEQPIDRPKCSACFRERSMFVNLVPFNVPGVTQDKGERA